MAISVRDVAHFMDPVRTAQSARTLIQMHRPPPGSARQPSSLRRTLELHQGRKTVRVPFIFFNTYLMPGFLGIARSPALSERAVEVGRMLHSEGTQRNGLIAALCEVWRPDEADQLLSPWGGARLTDSAQGEGHGGVLQPHQRLGAGLLTVTVASDSQNFRISRTAKTTFNNRGTVDDPDWWSNKGVLMTEIDVPGVNGNIEIFSTHLYNGGVNTPPPNHIRLPVQLAQVTELVEFYRVNHKPENIALVVGDFNIPAASPGYGQLKTRMARIAMEDVWPMRNGTDGNTNRFDTQPQTCLLPNGLGACQQSPAGVYCDDYRSRSDTQRIDYIFLEDPSPNHQIKVDFTRPRRRPFCRAPNAPEWGELASISDHLGIEMTLLVNPR
jgi:endonuclease/exonuclease/phosphatase family metal-dependent hydrolase